MAVIDGIAECTPNLLRKLRPQQHLVQASRRPRQASRRALDGFFACSSQLTFPMYRMMIDVSGKERVLLFCGSGCRKRMLEWWDELLGRADDGEDIREIRIWGVVGDKTDIVREWRRNNVREP